MSTAVDVLRKARELYAASPSHAHAHEHPMEGSHCPVTALVSAAIGLGCSWTAEAPAAHALKDAAGVPQLPEWNAAASTEDVLAAFDKAIEALS